MNAGVSMVPWGVAICPRRALPSVDWRVNL
jgi:hypothetical protein